jgi:hypothetical protein
MTLPSEVLRILAKDLRVLRWPLVAWIAVLTLSVTRGLDVAPALIPHSQGQRSGQCFSSGHLRLLVPRRRWRFSSLLAWRLDTVRCSSRTACHRVR